jgi:hypothetical protein
MFGLFDGIKNRSDASRRAWQARRAAERRGGWQSGQLGITHGQKPHELLPVLDEEWPFATMRRDGRI